jgi:hypothetical protein
LRFRGMGEQQRQGERKEKDSLHIDG